MPSYVSGRYNYLNFIKGWHFYAVPIRLQEEIRGCMALATRGEAADKVFPALAELFGYMVNSELEKVIKESRPGEDAGVELTAKQLRVLRLLSLGITDMDAALRLKIEPGTIKYHKTNMFKKLNVQCSIQAVVKALKLGLISLEEIDL